jgi:hypothetical protein
MIERAGVKPYPLRPERPCGSHCLDQKMRAPPPADVLRKQPEVGHLYRVVGMPFELEIPSRSRLPGHEPKGHIRRSQMSPYGIVTPPDPIGPVERAAHLA